MATTEPLTVTMTVDADAALSALAHTAAVAEVYLFDRLIDLELTHGRCRALAVFGVDAQTRERAERTDQRTMREFNTALPKDTAQLERFMAYRRAALAVVVESMPEDVTR